MPLGSGAHVHALSRWCSVRRLLGLPRQRVVVHRLLQLPASPGSARQDLEVRCGAARAAEAISRQARSGRSVARFRVSVHSTRPAVFGFGSPRSAASCMQYAVTPLNDRPAAATWAIIRNLPRGGGNPRRPSAAARRCARSRPEPPPPRKSGSGSPRCAAVRTAPPSRAGRPAAPAPARPSTQHPGNRFFQGLLSGAPPQLPEWGVTSHLHRSIRRRLRLKYRNSPAESGCATA